MGAGEEFDPRASHEITRSHSESTSPDQVTPLIAEIKVARLRREAHLNLSPAGGFVRRVVAQTVLAAHVIVNRLQNFADFIKGGELNQSAGGVGQLVQEFLAFADTLHETVEYPDCVDGSAVGERLLLDMEKPRAAGGVHPSDSRTSA